MSDKFSTHSTYPTSHSLTSRNCAADTRNTSRRTLLKAGAVAASSLFSPHVFAHGIKGKKLGIALVGLGYYSRDLLAPALQLTKHCELRGIVTGTPSKIPTWQKQYKIKDKNVYSYETMHELANNDDIDVVYIVTPTSLHEKHSLIGANAGKHVWCEKPMAMNEQECLSIINGCKKNKVQLTIGYRMQHEINTRTIMSYAKSKSYGDIQHIVAKAGYAGGAPDPNSWKLKRNMGGGALYDMGVYPINAARYGSNLEPTAVFANTTVQRKEIFKEVDETTYLTLEFPGGVQADCVTSVGQNINALRVQGRKGWYALDPMQSYTGVQGRTSSGVILAAAKENQQATQMDDDALAILGHQNILVPGEEGLKDIRIVQAALKSAQTGKTVNL